MNARTGSGPENRPFQFRLRTMMAIVMGIAALLGVLRLLGPDASLAAALMISAVAGAVNNPG